jgi:hypothetical protein
MFVVKTSVDEAFNKRNKTNETEIRQIRIELDSLKNRIDTLYNVYITANANTNNDWLCLKLAIAKVESNFKTSAINNTSNAGGIFQILPKGGFLCEANRIIKNSVYTDSCRFDITKSNEIFEIVNRHHNPNKCIYKAIKLHNSKAGLWYKDRILKEYDFFKTLTNTL